MNERNPFGGRNPQALYTPMSEDEQEVVARLAEANSLNILVPRWGLRAKPTQITYGDKRVSIYFTLFFDGLGIPFAPQPTTALDLELRTDAGELLMQKQYPVAVNGQPLQVCRGLFIELAWDIAIDHMSPELVKAIKPGAVGLTSRRLDPVTGERTLVGNMQLNPGQQQQLRLIEDGEAKARKQ